jgi:predicted ATPase/class 3 adenylate cyclase
MALGYGGGRVRNDLPTGTVTFLFSDIEGSTRLLDRLGDGYREVLEAHQRLLRGAFSRAGGVEVSTEGDSFFVVFPSPSRAVAAAIEGQRALARHGWPAGAEVRVRIGIHTGEGVLGGDNYVGTDVNRASRIAAAGHGGQVLVSEATRALVDPALPEGVALLDLGEHRLKDLPRPERLYQAVVPDLPADFPPPRSREVERPTLPRQLTTFVGRERERQEVKEALARGRLLTLTGPGGTGKTRLAIQVAFEIMETFEDGVVFVPLAPISDPALVVPTIVRELGLPEDPGRMPIEALIDHLSRKHLLLVLDNFEQVVDAAPQVGELLTATEAVSVLATSREPLGLAGERVYPVPPLSMPDVRHLPPLASLSQFGAVALFIERARAVKPDFEVTGANAPAIAEVTARLDGLPLAIELAAARAKILSPEAMLKRLESRLSLAAAGPRDLPERQQTLRDAIAWSYDLLDGEERRLFARISVFVGGFSLESAEVVCNARGELGLDTLDGLASLVNKSLARRVDVEGGDLRFLMLETIREYAAERLEEMSESAEVSGRHAGHFLEVAGRIAPQLFGPRQPELLDELEREHDNFRAAIDRSADRGDPRTPLQISSSLWRFWQMRGHLREGRERLEHLLGLPGAEDDLPVLADALEALGGIRYWMGEMWDARESYERCLAIRREIGDVRGIAEALYNSGFTYSARLSGERRIEEGVVRLEEALGLFRELGDDGGMARVLWGLGNLRYENEDYPEAERLFREALAIHERLGDPFGMAWDRFELGVTLQRQRRYEEARRFAEGALSLLAESGDTSGIPLVLGGLSALASQLGEGERAAVLYGAATALEAAAGAGLTRLNEEWEHWGDETRWNLDPETIAQATERGRRMTLEEAVAHALDRDQVSTP